MIYLKRTGGLPKERNITLCSDHFASECFERNLKKEFETGSTTEIYKLKDDAVPTIFSYKKDTPSRPSTKSRKQRAEKRKYITEVCSSPSVPTSATNTTDILDDSCDSSVPSFSCCANSSFIATEAGYDSNGSKILTREMSVMTDLSFSVNADVSFVITDFISPINTTFGTTTENGLISTDEGENTTNMSQEEKDYEYIHISTESDSSTGSENIDDSKANDTDNDMKFIVFFSCLVPLLQRCLTCNYPAVLKNTFTKGTALCVKLLCHNFCFPLILILYVIRQKKNRFCLCSSPLIDLPVDLLNFLSSKDNLFS